MSISMYDASIPHFIRMLENLSGIIEKTRIHAEARNIEESVFINARLAPDMYPLSLQVRIVTDMARACAARLAKIDIPKYEADETTFADYKIRIAKTIAFLQGIDADQINASHNQTVTISLYDKEVSYSGQVYLLDVIIPHFYFHITAAYAILRHHGIVLGKKDYIDNE